MRGQWELSHAPWKLIEPILRPKRRADGRGRPWQDTRAVLSGILWVLGAGAQWRELPRNIRRTRPATAAPAGGARGQAGADLAGPGPGVASPRETSAGGGLAVGPTKRGKGTKILALADDHSLPLAVSIVRADTANLGESGDFSLGSVTFGSWRSAASTASRTSSAWFA
jgi:hypothetical protein